MRLSLSFDGSKLSPFQFGAACLCSLRSSPRTRGTTSTPSAAAPTASLRRALGKPRQSAEKRRNRLRQQDAKIITQLKGQLSSVRECLKNEQDRLRAASRARIQLAEEHTKLGELVIQLRDDLKETRERASASLAIAVADAAATTTQALRRAEDRRRQEVDFANTRANSTLEKTLGENDRLKELAGRLRLERDTARSDALRYNSERNALRAEVATLRAERHCRPRGRRWLSRLRSLDHAPSSKLPRAFGHGSPGPGHSNSASS